MGNETSCCSKLCSGQVHCLFNVLCCCPVLFWNSLTIYLLPCLKVLFTRCFTRCCCCVCRRCCTKCYLYNDGDFPPSTESLSCSDNNTAFAIPELSQSSRSEIDRKVRWTRASELTDSEKMCLFEDGIEPNDVIQGDLGNCWLLAAICCLAEFPGAIENCFGSFEYSTRGKYSIKLYDLRIGKQKRETIVIDDFIPCISAHGDGQVQPLFSKPKGNELWVLLMEKAFAKFCGGYSELKGGHAMWAMQAITGDHVFRLQFDEEDQCWSRWDIEYQNASSRNPKKDWRLKDSKQRFNHERVLVLLQQYDKNDAVIAASVSTGHFESNSMQESKCQYEENQIVPGHTYTVRSITSVDGFNLLNLRNPWGEFEWNGDWCDGSHLWDKYPKIAKKLKFNATNNKSDGVFWIEFNDFIALFDTIQICDRSTIQNLHLDVQEDYGSCGVVKGCCGGCASYWCCCKGLREIYCGRVTSNQTVYNKVGSSWKAQYEGDRYATDDAIILGDQRAAPKFILFQAIDVIGHAIMPDLNQVWVKNATDNWNIVVTITHKDGFEALKEVSEVVSLGTAVFSFAKAGKAMYHAADISDKVIHVAENAQNAKRIGEQLQKALKHTVVTHIAKETEKRVYHENLFDDLMDLNVEGGIAALFKNVKDLRISFYGTDISGLDPCTYYFNVDGNPNNSNYVLDDYVYHATRNKDGTWDREEKHKFSWKWITPLSELSFDWPHFRAMEDKVEDILLNDNTIQTLLQKEGLKHRATLCVIRIAHSIVFNREKESTAVYAGNSLGTFETINAAHPKKRNIYGFVINKEYDSEDGKNAWATFTLQLYAQFTYGDQNYSIVKIHVSNHPDHKLLRIDLDDDDVPKQELFTCKYGRPAKYPKKERGNRKQCGEYTFYAYVGHGKHSVAYVEIAQS
eukprot:148888_1